MSGAVVKALVLELVRDRGALVMTFVLPVAFFLVFAFIFTGSSGADIRIQLAVSDAVGDADTTRLLAALMQEPGVVDVSGADADDATVREKVRSGSADVGLIVRAPLRGDRGEDGPPLVLVYDPTRTVAMSMLAGRVQKTFVRELPDVALGEVMAVLDEQFLDLSEVQRAKLKVGLERLREGGPVPDDDADLFGALYVTEAVVGKPDESTPVTYYAGAVAVLFLLFSAVHGAITLLEERDSGVIDRVLAGPASMKTLVVARFVFLSVMGFIQVLVIFLVAWLGFGVDLPGHAGGFALVTAATAMSASGMALALVTACKTKRQAQTLSNVAILILSAIGGSMVPRFLMPPLIQDLGWLTPNTWALEAYTSVFWREEPLSAQALPLLLLVGSGLVGLGIAILLARRWERV